MQEIRAVKLLKRGGSEFIYFLPSLELASTLVEHGRWFRPYQLEFAPFTFAPKLICKTCGSPEHKQCSKVVCKLCGKEHSSETCVSESVQCYYCKGDHSFKDCSKFKEKRIIAKAAKKKSYAEALMKPIRNIPHENLEVERRNTVIDSKSKEIISAYCKVAGIPFKEDILQKVEEQLKKNSHEATPSHSEEVKSSSKKRKETKTTSSESKEKTYAKAVIKSYDKSVNPSPNRSASPLMEMKGVERNIEAFCTCGLAFKPNPGWKNHFYKNLKCSSPKVTCPCGKLTLSPDNWKTTYGPMCKHLKSECTGSQ